MSSVISAKLSGPEKVVVLEDKVQSLEHQLDWFKRQLFGRKSEKRLLEDPPNQPLLDGLVVRDAGEFSQRPKKPSPTREAEAAWRRLCDRCGITLRCVGAKKTIRCSAPELEGPNAEDYEVIREQHTYRLAQRPAGYVVLEYVSPVLKHRASQTLTSPAAPPSLWPGSLADVSFAAGLLVEKFVYHQPLYRQHQRLARDGITLARGALTNLAHRGISLLEPIYQAQLRSILRSKILAIDETPIKGGAGEEGQDAPRLVLAHMRSG